MFLTSILSTLVLSVFTQTYDVEWGAEYKKSIFAGIGMLGMTGDNYHLKNTRYELGGPDVVDQKLMTFDLNHKLINEQNTTFKTGQNNLYIRKFIRTSSDTFALFSYDKRKPTEWQFYVSSFKEHKLETPHLIYEHSFEGNGLLKNSFGIQRSFLENVKVSHDKNKVCSVNLGGLWERKKHVKYAVAVFDNEMNTLWNKTQVIPYYSGKIADSKVSNKGEVFVLFKYYEDSEERRFVSLNGGLPKHSYKVFKISEDSFEEYDIEIEEGLLLVEIKLLLPQNEEDTFMITGFYTTNKEDSGLNGVFSLKVNHSNGDMRPSVHPFERDFLEGLNNGKKLEEGQGLSLSFHPKTIFQFADGSFTFIAEKRYSKTFSMNSTGVGGSSSIIYYSHQIIIPRFNKDGELLQLSKIDKSFNSPDFGLTSYFSKVIAGKIYLLYNNNKDWDRSKSSKRVNIKGSDYTEMTIINEKGEVEFQETILSSKDSEVDVEPKNSTYSNGHLIVYGTVNKRRYKCGKIELE